MVNPFICGSFHHQDEDDFENLSPCSTPKRSKRNLSRTRSSSNNKNPYANRGLDKFSALLADLEDKKQKIYSQVGPDDISFVRFVFSPHSNDVKPIVVKLKDKKQPTNDLENKQTNEKIESLDTNTSSNSANEGKEVKVELKKSISWNLKMENLKKPMFYLPLTIILILVFLAIYGRSFAIMCTTIGWYLIPTIRGGGSSRTSTRKPKRKKEYTRRFSEKSVVIGDGGNSPTSVMNGPIDKLPTIKHGHRSSWS